MSVISIVPARSGSLGISNKNLRLVGGRSLLQIAVETSRQVSLVDRTIVSSNSEHYLNSVYGLNEEDKIIRPNTLATNESSLVDTVLHVGKILNLDTHDIIVVLQPTSPLRARRRY